ncbi:hypothetical protein ACFSO7_00175 [Bacillus sp. CGMCC 1.16607]|uniref:hypothetical protein n=1 Tax=Bacillus sp. CGMCC 1.16607 TaxID=3351842 RepID=UPI00362C5CFF
MKKVISIFTVMLTLSILSACSDDESKVKDKNIEQVETEEEAQAIEEIEAIANEAEESSTGEEFQLEDKEEYNQIFKIFLDKKMEDSFRKLVGKDLDIFRVTFRQITPIPTESDDVYAFHGYMPGLEGVAEGVVIFDGSGKMWAATSEGEKVNFYYTDENEKHHPIIEDWRQSFFNGSEVVYKGINS